MQAWLLHIIYGAFMGSASQYKEAKKMLRTGVDVRLTFSLLSFAISIHGYDIRVETDPYRLPRILVYSGRP